MTSETAPLGGPASIICWPFIWPTSTWPWQVEFTLWLCQNSYGKSPFFMGKLTISMAIFNSYIKLPESISWENWEDLQEISRKNLGNYRTMMANPRQHLTIFTLNPLRTQEKIEKTVLCCKTFPFLPTLGPKTGEFKRLTWAFCFQDTTFCALSLWQIPNIFSFKQNCRFQLMMQGNTSITRSPVFLAVLHWTSIDIRFFNVLTLFPLPSTK